MICNSNGLNGLTSEAQRNFLGYLKTICGLPDEIENSETKPRKLN